MTHINPTDRRTFLRRGAMGAGAFWTLSLDGFMARRAEGASHTNGASPYGPIAPVAGRDDPPAADPAAEGLSLPVCTAGPAT